MLFHIAMCRYNLEYKIQYRCLCVMDRQYHGWLIDWLIFSFTSSIRHSRSSMLEDNNTGDTKKLHYTYTHIQNNISTTQHTSNTTIKYNTTYNHNIQEHNKSNTRKTWSLFIALCPLQFGWSHQYGTRTISAKFAHIERCRLSSTQNIFVISPTIGGILYLHKLCVRDIMFLINCITVV